MIKPKLFSVVEDNRHPLELDAALPARVREILDRTPIFEKYPELRNILAKIPIDFFAATVHPGYNTRNSPLFFSVVVVEILLILYDDALEGSHAENSDELKDALLGKSKPKQVFSPFYDPFAFLGQAWINIPIKTKERLIGYIFDYSNAIGEETDLLAKKHHPGVTEFLNWRKKSSGGLLGPYLSQLISGVFLEEIPNKVQDLFDCYNFIVIYQNDYVSFRNKRDEGKLNLVFALKMDLNVQPNDALDVIMTLHNTSVKRFIQLKKEIEEENANDGELKKFLECLYDSIIGATRYHERFARFATE